MIFKFRQLNDLADAQANFEQIETQFGVQVLTGAPTFNAQGGDYYFRKDTPGTANQRLYVCSGGSTWTGIL